MNRILVDLLEIIETHRLELHVPKVGFGERLEENIARRRILKAEF